MAKTAIKTIPMASFNSASLTSSYQLVNTGGTPNACFTLRITNAATTAVTFSFDGTTDADSIASNQTATLEGQANAQPGANLALFALGTTVYVKGTAGTGTITLAGYYV